MALVNFNWSRPASFLHLFSEKMLKWLEPPKQ
jgi:hypothetical protein